MQAQSVSAFPGTLLPPQGNATHGGQGGCPVELFRTYALLRHQGVPLDVDPHLEAACKSDPEVGAITAHCSEQVRVGTVSSDEAR